MKNVDYLKKMSLFNQLNNIEINKVANLASERFYPEGSIVFFEGEPGDAFYFLKSGRIKISKMTPDGEEQILKLIEPGGIFAEVILFSGENYPATARVLEDAKVGMIKKQDFEELIMKHPQLAIRLLKLLNNRLREAQMKVKEMGLYDTHSRTASLLLRLAQTYGSSKGAKITFKLELTRQDMASMIGTTRETVTRILSKFRKQGIIESKGNEITIIDPEELESWINS